MKYLLRSIKPLLALSLVLTGISVAPPAQATTGCTAGSYAAPYDASICIPAQPGYHVPTDGADAPTACPSGKYQPYYGQTSCLITPAGSATASSGSNVPDECIPGTYSASGGASSCTAAESGKYVSARGAIAATPCPATPSNAAPRERTGNTKVIDCFAFSGNSLVLPAANSTVDNETRFEFFVNTGIAAGDSDNVQITFTDTLGADPKPIYQFIARVTPESSDLKRGNVTVPLAWQNTSFFRGCSTSCSPDSLITSLPLSTYNIKVEVKDNSTPSVWVDLGTLSAVQVTDTITSKPMMYLQAERYFTDSAGVGIGLPESRLTGSAIIKISNAPKYLSPTITKTYILDSGALPVYIDLPFSGTQLPQGVASTSGQDITPGQWWVSVTYQDSWSNAAASDEWAEPLLITRSCLPGTFSVDGIKACIPVPAGHWITYPSLEAFDSNTRLFTPSPCDPGYYQPSAGGTACIEAEAGTYVDESGSTATTDCPVGKYQPSTGSIACIEAEAGTYVNQPGSTATTDCAVGTYQPSRNSLECLQADPGTYVNQTGRTATTDCAAGTYQPSTGTTACIQAEAGRYTSISGRSATTACAAGTYQPASGKTSCIRASAGHYVPSTGLTLQTECDSGTYQPSTGASECLPAAAGNYTITPGSTVLIPCATGMYQAETGQTFCNRATPGHYVSSPGSSSQNECDSGTYQPSPGAVECLPAEAGTYVDQSGSTATTDCSVGTYQPSTGAAECIPAEAGSYTNETGSVATTLCDAGSYQSETGQTSCVLASANHFVASAGQASQTPCPSGYSQPNTGSTSCDAIQTPENLTPVVCPALTYSSFGATSVADCKPKPCVVSKGKSASSACMLASIAKVLPAKAKVKIKMSKSFKKICKVKGSKVKALKPGTCTVTITVKPKKGKSIKYRVNVTGI